MCGTIAWFPAYGMEFLPMFQKLGNGYEKEVIFCGRRCIRHAPVKLCDFPGCVCPS